MAFTSPSYALVTQYSVLVEFKTWSGPSWAGPGQDMPALWHRELTGSRTQRRELWSDCVLESVQVGHNVRTHEALYI